MIPSLSTRAIARENLRTEISDYSGWFGANVMDSQSRGRDIYLAMSPSGIAITPEFCSKNPYAIALPSLHSSLKGRSLKEYAKAVAVLY